MILKTYDEFLNESHPRYFFRIEYRIESGTYRQPEEVLKTILYFAKASKKIESYSYEFNEKTKGRHFTKEDLVYDIKAYSNLTKSELQSYFDNKITKYESFKIK